MERLTAIDYFTEFDFLDKDNKDWKDTNAKFSEAVKNGDNDTQFKCVLRICYGLVKQKLLKSKVVFSDQEAYELALDATMVIIERYRRRGPPDKLTSYCYLPVIGVLYDRKKIFADKINYWTEDDFRKFYNEEEIIYNEEIS